MIDNSLLSALARRHPWSYQSREISPGRSGRRHPFRSKKVVTWRIDAKAVGLPSACGSETCELVDSVNWEEQRFLLPIWERSWAGGLDDEKQGSQVVGEGPLPEHVSALRGTFQVSRGSPN
jgi:hypothetical protein